jgi:hypothetical protein
MKRADTFIKAKINLKYDLIASIKELYTAIGCAVIDLKDNYRHIYDEIYVPVGLVDSDCEWGLITQVYRIREDMQVRIETPTSIRDRDIYDLSIDDLVRLYEQLEIVHKYEKSLK